MKVVIANNKADELRLRLEASEDGVDLVTVDNNGDTEWHLLSIRNDGSVVTYDVSSETGLKLDKTSHVVFTKV